MTDSEVGVSPKPAITDTGTSCIYGPYSAVNTLKTEIESAVQGNIDDGIFDCSERENLPTFELLFGEYWFEILPEDYVVPIFEDGSGCMVCMFDDSDMWILGDVFLRGFYSIHDHTNNRMGFVPYVGSSKSKPQYTDSTPEIPDPFPGCDDTNDGATDSYGDSCDWYAENSWGCG